MELTVFGIKNCDTMKKAMKWLDDNGIAYHFHDYKKEGVNTQALRQWIDTLGWETVINRRGTTWRKLDEALRDSMDADKAMQVAQDNPSIIKRPILQNDSILTAGFKADAWQQLLKG
ncbi:arsC-like protein [Alcanivorax hongdengensis A-11-3]|uniref:ArsC-like protein n=1 Tax=Alcanivorax hongdengensis A-11-3 TaxID=1177179 RepID=L0WGY6_9GAMM|nr:ArsC family reductase [Alcanivorax hongdengensis]EKF75100.1 arsC-like protein [Alcanivorax hongdengensis A-11-3]